MKRLRILLSAYACLPRAGGEDAVGWRWAVYLAKHHDVTVITYSRGNVAKIEQYRHETAANFVYVTLPAWIERFQLWSKGQVAVWFHYAIWQILAGQVAKKLQQQQPFDLVHHVVYNQYRTPSFGYTLGPPFVFGPVGGAETVPLPLFQDLQLFNGLKEMTRQVQVRSSQWLRSRPKPNTFYIFANPSTQATVIGDQPYDHSYLLPAVYTDPAELADLQSSQYAPSGKLDEITIDPNALTLVMPGRLLDWKGPILALRALAAAISNGAKVQLILVGSGPLETKVKELCQSLNLGSAVQLVPWLARRELMTLLSQADALLYPAFRDSGSMVVAESYLLGKPAIILDIDSQFYVEPAFGVKVAISPTYAEIVQNLANGIQWASEHRLTKLPEMGKLGNATLLETLSWEHKLQVVQTIYETALRQDSVSLTDPVEVG